MLFLSVAKAESMAAALKGDHPVELRLDLFSAIDVAHLQRFMKHASRSVMLTVRKASQGGGFRGSESERESLIEHLLALEPPFFDLEYDMRPGFIQGVLKRYPKTKFVLSYHCFEGVPDDLEGIWRAMQSDPVWQYKIAAMTHSTNEALKLLLFGKAHPKTSVICMGARVAFGRVLGPVVGHQLDYACLEEATGPGQLTVQEWSDIYHYAALNRETAIYGLIGDPVDQSVGHVYHNAVFRQRNVNAVYVKMQVKPEELAEFMQLAPLIGICGLSVTMPLKEKVIPFLDEIEPIGAVNTLLFTGGRVRGTNTDGLGALDAIEKRGNVRGKKMVLLGAGGVARAIAFEAKRRGARVVILNRTVQRAKELAKGLNCEAGGLDEVPSDVDILINCCSADPMPIDPERIRPESVAMDVVYHPRETRFLQEASRKKCQIVFGEEMFLNQAARQTAFWLTV